MNFDKSAEQCYDSGHEDFEIRQMMEQERWRSAMLFADCVCQMAMAKGDMLMHDYFAKIRDGLRQVLLTD